MNVVFINTFLALVYGRMGGANREKEKFGKNIDSGTLKFEKGSENYSVTSSYGGGDVAGSRGGGPMLCFPGIFLVSNMHYFAEGVFTFERGY